ncbi:MAG: methyl-accepting chemotaxis protein, partial [Pseudomonadota bacterium]
MTNTNDGRERSAQAGNAGGAGRKAGLRIGGRIVLLAGLGVVGLLGLGGTYLFGDVKIGSEFGLGKQYRALAGLAARVDRDALQMRRREKDFILRLDEKYAGKYHGAAEDLLARLGDIEKLAIAAEVKDEVDGVRLKINAHIEQFDKLVEQNRTLGFNEKEGLQGSLRKAVHEVETKLEELQLDALTVKMLMMRRHEKDFIMRGADKYIERIDKRREEFGSLLMSAAISIEDSQAVERMLDQYVADFHAYTEGYKAEKAGRKQLSAIYSEAEPFLEALFAAAEKGDAEAQASLEEIRGSTRVAVISIGATILAVFLLFAFVLARSITQPLKAMTATMTQLADGDTEVEVPAIGRRDEIGEMAQSVQIFKDNTIEKVRLEKEQAAAQQRAEEEKRQTMNDMADRFERTVKEVVDGVGSSATEMQATAQQMS